MMPDFCDGEEELCILVVGLMLWRLRMMVVDVDGGECPSIEGMLWPYLALSDWQPHHIPFHQALSAHFCQYSHFPIFLTCLIGTISLPTRHLSAFPTFVTFPTFLIGHIPTSLLTFVNVLTFYLFAQWSLHIWVEWASTKMLSCSTRRASQTTNLLLKSVKINVFLFQPPCEMNLLHHRIQGPPASRK